MQELVISVWLIYDVHCTFYMGVAVLVKWVSNGQWAQSTHEHTGWLDKGRRI